MSSDFITIPYTAELQSKYAKFFNCGNFAIDSFIRNSESLDVLFGTTYVCLSGDNILGFYNIGTGYVEDRSEMIPVRQGGSLYLNYFALDGKYQKVKATDKWYFSDWLFYDLLKRAEYIQENIVGFSFITLASTEEGHNLYKRNGFEEMEDDMFFAKNPGEKKCDAMYFAMDF